MGSAEFVTIPFGYEDLSAVQQAAIVPICIRRRDPKEREIAWGWFEAVSAVQNPLRRLVRNFLYDEWRVSEVVDWAVLHNWTRHGADLGRAPQRRVYLTAWHYSEDQRAGDRRARRGLNVPLEGLDPLVDPGDYETRYCYNVDFVRMDERLAERGVDDVRTTLDMLRDGCSWKEIGERSARPVNTANRRFWRWTRKVLKQG